MVTSKAAKSTAPQLLAGFDLQEFKRQKAAIEQAAATEISSRLEIVNTALTEIKEIANLAGIEELQLDDLYYKVDSMRDEFRDWNSSNC